MLKKQAPATTTPLDASAAPRMRLGHIYLDATSGRWKFWNTVDLSKTEAFLRDVLVHVRLDDDVTTSTRPVVIDPSNKVLI